MPNFDVTPTLVIPIEETYHVQKSIAEGFKKEYMLVSKWPTQRYKLLFSGITDTNFDNNILAHYRAVSDGYAPFYWTTVPDYIDTGFGSGVSLKGRWLKRPRFIPQKNYWNIELNFEVDVYHHGPPGAGMPISPPPYVNFENRITQEVIEVLRKGVPYARTTQEVIEVLRVGNPYARTTQEVIEILRNNYKNPIVACGFYSFPNRPKLKITPLALTVNIV
jgi:hypothetical protein